jgi:hypothetical protein
MLLIHTPVSESVKTMSPGGYWGVVSLKLRLLGAVPLALVEVSNVLLLLLDVWANVQKLLFLLSPLITQTVQTTS